jgi:hypothetical protein
VIQPPGFLILGSIEAMRPVFMIVMGSFLLLIAWRMGKRTRGWAGGMLKTGSVLLAFGYAVVVPLYEAKQIVPLAKVGMIPGDAAVALGWHIIKMLTMNLGWVLTGVGLALHARLFETVRVRSAAPAEASTPAPLHETAA